MAWKTVASSSLATSGGAWANYTIRQVINSAAMLNTGNPICRVTFKAGATEGLSIGAAYIGQAADSGDAYDFATTPTQILFGGAGTKLISAGGTELSDEITFTIPVGKNIVIAMFIANDTAHDTIIYQTTLSNWKAYYKTSTGNDAATVNTTGYADTGWGAAVVSLIETYTPDGIQAIFFN